MRFRKWMTDTATYVVLTIFTLLTLIPIWWIVQLSFDDASSLMSTNITLLPKHFTLNNYVAVFQMEGFTMWLKNSLIFAGGATVIALTFATFSAYAFSRFEFPGKKAGLVGFLVFMMLPATASLLPQYLILRSFHLINTYLGMILVYTAGAQTFAIWNLKGYFDTISKELEEAAIIDGCNRWQVFYKMIIPLSTPALAITALITFTGPWTDFVGIFLLISDPDKYTLAMGLQKWASDLRNVPWSIFAAGSLIVSAPLAILYMVFQKYIVSGLSAGGVKG